ncbi:MAG: hypothetical protein ABSB19_04755 [Methylomonas sp.]|jgi:hypothetical protein
MQKTDDRPWWVVLALSNIQTRKTALWLILSNVLFSAYCVPWVSLYGDVDWVAQVFLIEDWEWFLFSAPFTVWYWFGVKWIDKNNGWRIADTENAGVTQSEN